MLSSRGLRRALSSAASAHNYYRILGTAATASSDDIKKAFRDLAKVHHPDVQQSSSGAGAAETFKLINEAYSVLSNPAKRREYDNSLRGGGAAPRGRTLQERNEGVFGGAAPPRRPSSMYDEGAEAWVAAGPRGVGAAAGAGRGAGGGGGSGAGGSSSSSSSSQGSGASAEDVPGGGEPYNAADHDEAYRTAMHRAAERAKEGARFRATLARLQRPKVDVPPPGRAWAAAAVPAAVAAIWVVNYALFMSG